MTHHHRVVGGAVVVPGDRYNNVHSVDACVKSVFKEGQSEKSNGHNTRFRSEEKRGGFRGIVAEQLRSHSSEVVVVKMSILTSVIYDTFMRR